MEARPRGHISRPSHLTTALWSLILAPSSPLTTDLRLWDHCRCNADALQAVAQHTTAPPMLPASLTSPI